MILRKLIWRTSPKPEDVPRLTAAYETSPLPVGRMDGDDGVTEIVAKKIIEICQTGMRDPELIAQLGATSASDGPNEIIGPALRGMDAFFLGLISTAIVALVGMLLFVAFAH